MPSIAERASAHLLRAIRLVKGCAAYCPDAAVELSTAEREMGYALAELDELETLLAVPAPPPTLRPAMPASLVRERDGGWVALIGDSEADGFAGRGSTATGALRALADVLEGGITQLVRDGAGAA